MPPMQADLYSMPVTHDSCSRNWKTLTNLLLKISTMTRKFQWMQKRLRSRRKRLCAVWWRALSLSVTAFGVTSKTGQQQLAELQSAAPARGSEAFEVHWMVSSSENSTISLQACVAGIHNNLLHYHYYDYYYHYYWNDSRCSWLRKLVSLPSDIGGVCNISHWKWLDILRYFKYFNTIIKHSQRGHIHQASKIL